jgi:hypothetical protein
MSQPHQSEEATMKTVGGETARNSSVHSGSFDKGAESLAEVWCRVGRYVALEKRAGWSGDWMRAQRIAAHVRRASSLYGFTSNPY